MTNLIQCSSPFNRLSRFDPLHDDDWFQCFWMRPFPRELEVTPQIRIDMTENGIAI